MLQQWLYDEIYLITSVRLRRQQQRAEATESFNIKDSLNIKQAFDKAPDLGQNPCPALLVTDIHAGACPGHRDTSLVFRILMIWMCKF